MALKNPLFPIATSIDVCNHLGDWKGQRVRALLWKAMPYFLIYFDLKKMHMGFPLRALKYGRNKAKPICFYVEVTTVKFRTAEQKSDLRDQIWKTMGTNGMGTDMLLVSVESVTCSENS